MAVILAYSLLLGASWAAEYCPDCITPDPFRPSDEEMAEVSIIHHARDADVKLGSSILVDDILYSRYWQIGNDEVYVFHPMAWGRYVFNTANNYGFEQKLPTLADRVGATLPNGGIGFYYPEVYPLDRMRGPDLMYSAISQSEILAGFIRFHQYANSAESLALLNRVKKGMFFPHEKGGVDLGVAQLEMPLFHSNPEIILNGWLHALLHLSDYAQIMDDKEVAEYVHTNLLFFADNHRAWYDEERNISRYSDSSPQRIVVIPSVDDQEFQAVYTAKARGLKNYVFEPIIDLNNEYSAYDFKIVYVNEGNGKLTMTIACSSLFRTELVSDEPFTLTLREGGYDPLRATPDASGDLHEVNSVENNGHHVAAIALEGNKLICGYPTNFAKANKKNYYHIQHIVALLYLAKDAPYEDAALNKRIIDIAMEWHRRTAEFVVEGYQFEEPQKVLNSLNFGKMRPIITDASQLFAD